MCSTSGLHCKSVRLRKNLQRTQILVEIFKMICAFRVMLWAQQNKADEVSGTITVHRESKKQMVRKPEA
jgi:hypothetical protein